MYIYSSDAVPSGAPSSVSIVAGSTNLSLSIDPPQPEDQNGVLTGYLVVLTEASNGRRSEISSANSTVTLRNLTPFTLYFINVAARTVNGSGPLSTSYQVSTLEAGNVYPYCVIIIRVSLVQIIRNSREVLYRRELRPELNLVDCPEPKSERAKFCQN